jgi:hypothetical protein
VSGVIHTIVAAGPGAPTRTRGPLYTGTYTAQAGETYVRVTSLGAGESPENIDDTTQQKNAGLVQAVFATSPGDSFEVSGIVVRNGAMLVEGRSGGQTWEWIAAGAIGSTTSIADVGNGTAHPVKFNEEEVPDPQDAQDPEYAGRAGNGWYGRVYTRTVYDSGGNPVTDAAGLRQGGNAVGVLEFFSGGAPKVI